MIRPAVSLVVCLLLALPVACLAAPPAAAPAGPDMMAVIEKTPTLSVIDRLLVETGLAISLQSEGPYTLFAPTNAAFEALGADKLAFLEKPEHRDRLRAQLQKYIVIKRLEPAALLGHSQALDNFARSGLPVDGRNGGVKVGGIAADPAPLPATNGVIYRLSGVLPIDDSVFDED